MMPVSTGHHGIDVSPDGKMVYVSKIGSDKVNVIDLIKLEFVK
jgi:DNA-binding beta-propeller fold protein YncE